MEYLPTFARTKSPSYVGKYTRHGVYGYGHITSYMDYNCFFHYKIQCIKSSASLPIEAIGRYRGDYPMVTHPEIHGKIYGKRHIVT